MLRMVIRTPVLAKPRSAATEAGMRMVLRGRVNVESRSGFAVWEPRDVAYDAVLGRRGHRVARRTAVDGLGEAAGRLADRARVEIRRRGPDARRRVRKSQGFATGSALPEWASYRFSAFKHAGVHQRRRLPDRADPPRSARGGGLQRWAACLSPRRHRLR